MRTGLRFPAPCHPGLSLFDNSLEPARLLFLRANSIQQNQGVDVALPAAREGKVHFGKFLGNHPKREDISPIWT